MDNSRLFSVIIRDDSGEDPIIYTGHVSALPWVILSQFQNNYFIYDWVKFFWKSISYADFVNYRDKNQSVVIQTGISDKFWLEYPMTQKRANNSEVVKAKKIPRRESINEYFISSQNESSLKKYIQTEQLLDELSRDDY